MKSNTKLSKITTQLSLTLLIFFTVTTTLYSQTNNILSQPDAPITIDEFEASYQEDGRYSNEGVRYDIEYTNSSSDDIVAFSFGFYAFDVFNRSLGRPLEGFTIEDLGIGDSDTGAWVQRTYNASLFREYGTAVSYIARVRYQNGTIWEYDQDSILDQLQEFEESLTLEDLQSEE